MLNVPERVIPSSRMVVGRVIPLRLVLMFKLRVKFQRCFGGW